MRQPSEFAEGKIYAEWLRALRSYQRIRRRVFRSMPQFLSKEASDIFGYLSPVKTCATLLAIGSCPRHFFRRFQRVLNCNSPFFSTPVPLMGHTVAALGVSAGLISKIAVGKVYLFALLILVTVLMPVLALIPALVISSFDPKSSMEDTVRKRWGCGPRAFEDRNATITACRPIFSINTYRALDYKRAPLGYLYFTVYLLLVSCMCFVVGVAITFADPVFLLLVIPVVCISVIVRGPKLFIDPYLSLFTYLIPPYQDGSLSLSFAESFELLLKHDHKLKEIPTNYTLSVRICKEQDRAALLSLSEMWDHFRPRFVQEQDETQRQGAQIFARFIITRANHSRLLTNCIDSLGFRALDLVIFAPQAYEDLQRMIKTKTLVNPISKEFLELLSRVQRG